MAPSGRRPCLRSPVKAQVPETYQALASIARQGLYAWFWHSQARQKTSRGAYRLLEAAESPRPSVGVAST
jgi:hypothetical protein